jgi:hypothetical protein
VHWLTGLPGWDIGLAPLADSSISRSRSAMKALEYAALAIPVLASDVPAYRLSLADGAGGMLVGPAPDDWYASINWLIRNPALRRTLSLAARRCLEMTGTLAAQATTRREVWAAWARNAGSRRLPLRARAADPTKVGLSAQRQGGSGGYTGHHSPPTPFPLPHEEGKA